MVDNANYNVLENLQPETPQEVKYSQLLPVGVNAKTQKRRFYAPPSSAYGPSGTNICRIQLNSPGFMNLQDGLLFFTVTNTTGNAAYDAYIDGSAHSFIQRLTVYSPKMEILEQIDDYHVLASLLSDAQLSKEYRGSVGNSLAGYSKDDNTRLKFLRIACTGASIITINGLELNFSGAHGASAVVYASFDGFIFSRGANQVAGSFLINGTAITPGSGTSLTVNGINFVTSVAGGNTITINGLTLQTTVAGSSIETNYVAGVVSTSGVLPGLTKTDSSVYQSEFIANGAQRTFGIPLISGFLNINRYLPTQFLSGQGVQIEILWAPANEALFTPNGSAVPVNYSVSDIYYEVPIVDFKQSEFYSSFKQMIDGGMVKFHGSNFVGNRKDYFASTSNTITIGSRQRSIKSIFACFRPNGRSQSVPKTSNRTLPPLSAATDNFTYVFRLGSELYPPLPITVRANNVAELYSEILKSFAILSSTKVDTVIDRYNLLGSAGFIALDTEAFAQNSMKLERGLDTITNNLPMDLVVTSSVAFPTSGASNIFLMHDVIYMLDSTGNIIRSN